MCMIKLIISLQSNNIKSFKYDESPELVSIEALNNKLFVFLSVWNPSTKNNVEKFGLQPLENPYYSWSERVRFVQPKGATDKQKPYKQLDDIIHFHA